MSVSIYPDQDDARWSAQDQGSTAVPAPPLPPVAELMKAGILTGADFQQQKTRILNG